MTPAGPLQGRQNYHPDCQAATNSPVTLQLHASYVCLAWPSTRPRRRGLEALGPLLPAARGTWGKGREPDAPQNQPGPPLLPRHQEPDRAWESGLRPCKPLPEPAGRVIKEWGTTSTLHKMGTPEVGMVEYLFDKLTLGDSDKN
nr:ferritin heavy chain-like [Camelus dromedarius]